MTLSDWLSDLERRHPTEIDLGLERVRLVFERLALSNKMPYSIIVGGTNGKGSTLQAISNGLSALGFRVGTYTSPHLYIFNERVCLQGMQVDDETLVRAFEVVESARKDVSLTYFEFTTLAAFTIFADRFEAQDLDVAVCEVGLGGRLDAVNVLDGQLSIVTSIGLDHQDWLGDTLEKIAFEKAGIFRRSTRGLVGETFPRNVLSDIIRKGYSLSVYGDDFGGQTSDKGGYQFFSTSGEVSLNPCLDNSLPKNNLCLAMQACIIALESLDSGNRGSSKDLDLCAQAIAETEVPGRLQIVRDSPLTLFDVAHNAAAAKVLADYLAEHHSEKPVKAVFSCLKDKDIRAIVGQMDAVVEEWFVAPMDGARAMPIEEIQIGLASSTGKVRCYECLADAFAAASKEASEGEGMILAFGSFYVLEALRDRALTA